MKFKTIICYYDRVTGEIIRSDQIERNEYILTNTKSISYKKSIVANEKAIYKTIEIAVKKNNQLKLKL